MPLLGAGYAIVEHQEANKGLTCFINKFMPSCVLLILLLVFFAYFE